VDYDGETDCCVGFIIPVNENGLPIVDSFIAVSFAAIEKMFSENAVSKYAYVCVYGSAIMWQCTF